MLLVAAASSALWGFPALWAAQFVPVFIRSPPVLITRLCRAVAPAFFSLGYWSFCYRLPLCSKTSSFPLFALLSLVPPHCFFVSPAFMTSFALSHSFSLVWFFFLLAFFSFAFYFSSGLHSHTGLFHFLRPSASFLPCAPDPQRPVPAMPALPHFHSLSGGRSPRSGLGSSFLGSSPPHSPFVQPPLLFPSSRCPSRTFDALAQVFSAFIRCPFCVLLLTSRPPLQSPCPSSDDNPPPAPAYRRAFCCRTRLVLAHPIYIYGCDSAPLMLIWRSFLASVWLRFLSIRMRPLTRSRFGVSSCILVRLAGAVLHFVVADIAFLSALPFRF